MTRAGRAVRALPAVRARRRGALLLVAALVLGGATGVSGCGPGTAPAPGGPASGVSTPTTAAGTVAPPEGPQEPQGQEVLVEVVVNGGLAGVRNQLVVHYDGTWTSRSGAKPPRTGRMTPAEAAELRAALEDPAYARVPGRPTGGPIPDGFQYFVTYRHRLVVADDGERPPALQRVFDALPEGGPPTGP
ncbi:hypothetical protein ACPB9E_02000 [Streptomyces exfoliatus]|uniref:hypothetical protein n=1 Tax=Streptomyces exfoliatus TaxID=1905 RepID=UPI003C2CA735